MHVTLKDCLGCMVMVEVVRNASKQVFCKKGQILKGKNLQENATLNDTTSVTSEGA